MNKERWEAVLFVAFLAVASVAVDKWSHKHNREAQAVEGLTQAVNRLAAVEGRSE